MDIVYRALLVLRDRFATTRGVAQRSRRHIGLQLLAVVAFALGYLPSASAQHTFYFHTMSQALAACVSDESTHVYLQKACYTYRGVSAYFDDYLTSPGSADWTNDYVDIGFTPIAPGTPGKNAGPSCHCAATNPVNASGGDPINLGTGNEYRDEEDASLGELSFHRYYNSQPEAVSANIGVNWRNSFDRSVVAASASPTQATVLRPDGAQIVFNLQSGVWISDLDVSDTLSSTSDGSGNITSWTYFEAATRHYESFDANGRITSIMDENQNTTSLTYAPASAPSGAGKLNSVTDPEGRHLTIAYNSSGNIATVTLPDNGVLTYSYDTSGNLQQVTYPDLSTRVYHYNESGLTSGASFPNNLTGVTDETGARYASVSYDSVGHANSSVLAGNVDFTQIVYNSNGTTSVTYPLGAHTTLNFVVTSGTVHGSTVSTPCGSSCDQANAAATFDTNGYPASATDWNGNITKTTYDANGLLDQQVDATGTPSQRTTNLTWNTTLRVPLTRTVLNASGGTVASTAWVYNAFGQPLARCEIDPAVSYTCAASGTPPTGVRRWTYTYCNAVGTGCPLVGLMLTATGPRTDLTQTTTYSYYTSSSATGCGTPGAACYQPGDLYQVTDPLGHVTTITSYDADGRVTRVTDANGVNTDMTYTPRGWLHSRSVGGAVTTIGYTPYGAVSSITDPDNVTTSYGYDTAHRLTRISDAQGNYVQYTLDAAGDKTGEQVYDSTGTLHKSLSRTFNPLGQLTTVLDGLNHTVFDASGSGNYDANGNLVLSKDALGIQRQQGYDALNRLTSTIENYQGTDPATQNTQTSLTYDALDRVTAVTDPSSLLTGYTYDGLGNLTALQSPDSGTSGGSSGDLYDAAGNRTQHTDARGIVSQYTYDKLNRLTGKIYPAHPGLNVTYVYDQATPITGCPTNFNIGHLTGMTDASGTTAWCYTNQGDIREVNQIIKQVVGTTTTNVSYLHGYAYTAGRRLQYLQYPSGFELKYGFDSDGRVTTIGYLQQPGPYGSYTNSTLTPLVTAVSYAPFGPVTGYSWAQGSQAVQRTYDPNYALTDITSNALNLHFQRDTMGRVGAEGTAPGANPLSESYRYDPLNRLSELDDPNGVAEQSFTYGPTGDRLSKTVAGQGTLTYGYQTGSHRLTAVGSASRLPDANGNTTAMTDPNGALVGLGYDDRNLLTTVTSGGSTIGSYQYNGQGVRVWRTITSPSIGQAATIYDPTGTGNLYGEYFATDYREYVYLDGIPVASATNAGRAAPGINYDYADQLGSIRAIANTQAVGTYQWPWLNNAFGEQPTSGAGNFYTRFPGQYYDVETGLMYNGARYYEPTTGRYLQSDPIGLSGGISTYAYAGGNPISNFDASGLYCSSGGGSTYCSYPGGPSFIVPTPAGFEDFGNNDPFYHAYDIQRPIGSDNPACVMNGFINNPVPDNPNGGTRPATFGGTSNIAYIPVIGTDNQVTSYVANNLSGPGLVVVNMTGNGSTFSPGYVARTVSDGIAHTYGEGTNAIQSDLGQDAWGPIPLGALNNYINQQVWGGQMNRLISNTSKRCGCGN